MSENGTSTEQRREHRRGTIDNWANVAFWNGFREWCNNNGKSWCQAPVQSRGNPYYDPNHDPLGNKGECGHVFFTVSGTKSGSIRNVGPLVTVGIYCPAGEEQRERIKRHESKFTEAFAGDAFDFTDWTSGKADGVAKRILFIRKADFHDTTGWEALFRRMADDYERIRHVLQADHARGGDPADGCGAGLTS